MKRRRSSLSSIESNNVDSGDDEQGPQNELVSSGESEGVSEVDVVSPDIKLGLEECLESLATASCFASSGEMIQVNPGISISGLGTVGLPLSERDAELIRGVSHQAPYGRGSETVVDTTVRQTWELNADQFELRNPAWSMALEDAVDRVADDLDVFGGPTGIKAIPYKMLLYEKGSMFKEHRDSEKEPGMFGTLVICLPSKHEGGEINVTHGGQTMVLNTAESSEFIYTYLCWYADVKHEIKEVTAGHRLVLTYNLVNANPENPAQVPARFDGTMKQLGTILALWKDQCRENTTGSPDMLACILQHLYTKQTLCSSGLKGGDRIVGHSLSELCQKHGFSLYLAMVEYGMEGECQWEDNDDTAWEEMYWRARNNEEPDYHDITDVESEWLELRQVVDLNGTKLFDTAPLELSQIIPKMPFEGDPSREEFSGPTGNQGVSATHFYHRSAIVLVPAEYDIDFHFGAHKESEIGMSHWLDRLIQSCHGTDGDTGSDMDLVKACRLISKGAREWWRVEGQRMLGRAQGSFSDRLLGKAIHVGLRLNNRSVCCEALRSAMERLPQPETAEVIDRFGLPELQHELNHAVRHFQFMHQRLQALIATYDEYCKLANRSEPDMNDILKWVKDQVLHDIYSMRMYQKVDGMKVANAGRIKLIKSSLRRRLIPALRLHMNDANPFGTYRGLLGFLSEVSATIPRGTAQDAFRAVLEDFIPCIVLTAHDEKRMRIGSSDFIPPANLDPNDMIQLVEQCITLDLGLQVHRLCDKLQGLAATEEPAAVVMKMFFIPFTGKLSKMVAGHTMSPVAPETKARLSTFTAEIFDLFANRCVGPKPTPPSDWRRAECGCGCEKCLQLDSFLGNPSQEECSIPAGDEDGVKHLTSQLPRIHPGGLWAQEVPEYDTRVEPGFTLNIRKTMKAWSHAVESWEKDRDAAQTVFDNAIDDEGKRNILRMSLNRLGEGHHGSSV